MKAGDRYRLGYALVAWFVLLTVAAILLPSHRPADPKLTGGLIGCTLLLSAYTLLALAIEFQNQLRALKGAPNPIERRLWLLFQTLLIVAAASAVIWSVRPR
jgi:hypothetical protein